MAANPTSPSPSRRRTVHYWARDTGWAAAITAFVVLAILIAWVSGGDRWFDDPALRVIGWIGVVVSLAGVVIAVLIFRRQTRASRTAESGQSKLLGEIQRILGEVHMRVSAMQEASNAVSDEEDTGAGEEDEWATDIPEAPAYARYVTSPTGRRRRLFEPTEVPLAVIASLVTSWKQQGFDGKWTIGMLRGAFRTEGKGNHPWFLVFEPRPGQATAWRVSRGPGGKDYASEIPSPANWD